jgi:hypothetical protein
MTIAVPDHTGAHPAQSSQWFTQTRAQRFPMPTPDLAIVGSSWGPQVLPDQMITINPTSVDYTDLWSSLDPSGMPARAMPRGTYVPPVTGAMKLGG